MQHGTGQQKKNGRTCLNGLNDCGFQLVHEGGQLRVVIQLGAVLQAACPRKDGGHRVGGRRLPFLVLPPVPRHRACMPSMSVTHQLRSLATLALTRSYVHACTVAMQRKLQQATRLLDHFGVGKVLRKVKTGHFGISACQADSCQHQHHNQLYLEAF